VASKIASLITKITLPTFVESIAKCYRAAILNIEFDSFTVFNSHKVYSIAKPMLPLNPPTLVSLYWLP